MLHSVIANTEKPIHFHILVPEFEYQKGINFLKLLQIRNNVYFSFYNVKADRFHNSLNMDGILHFSNAALYRIFMAELLPESVNQILYLDGDTLIDLDIKELFKMYSHSIFSARIENFDTGYFNSGVFITSLQYWRENNITNKLISYLIDNPHSIYKDQDSLNSFFREQNEPLATKYNFPAIKSRNLNQKPKESRIYHFTGTIKPWKSHAPQNYPFKLWRTYCRKLFPEYNFKQHVKMSFIKFIYNNIKVIVTIR